MNERTLPPASTLWLTGLSGAGKTTLAHAVSDALAAAGVSCRILDGDLVRRELSADLGFSRADRSENVRRVALKCRQLNEEGVWAIAALISPYRDDRELARRSVGQARFVEVYMATPLAVCESRDPKGLYRQARSGAITNFTGISDPYDAPLDPELRFDTGAQSLADCVAGTMTLLLGERSIGAGAQASAHDGADAVRDAQRATRRSPTGGEIHAVR